MGEEEEKKKKKKPEGHKKEEKSEEAPKAEKVATKDGKKEGKKPEEPKAEAPAAAEIVLKAYMHCEGCARKVRQCLKGFDGVEDVVTDCKESKVVVRGEKADPLRVLERVQRKSHRQVDLVSPIPKPPPPPPAEQPKKTEDKGAPKMEEKKEETAVITVVLGVYMHCEACAQVIKKRILRMKGVESAEPDLKTSQVKVKGPIDPEMLIDYVYKRTGKHATIVKVVPEKKPEDKPKEGKDDKKPKKEAKKEEADPPQAAEAEVRKEEALYHYYPEAKAEAEQRQYQFYRQGHVQVQEYYAHPPQMFSDENPNACTLM